MYNTVCTWRELIRVGHHLSLALVCLCAYRKNIICATVNRHTHTRMTGNDHERLSEIGECELSDGDDQTPRRSLHCKLILYIQSLSVNIASLHRYLTRAARLQLTDQWPLTANIM